MGRKILTGDTSNPDVAVGLGSELRLRRKQLGLTMDEVARAAGISRVTLHRLEKGEPSVSVGALVSVANAIGAPISLNESFTTDLPESVTVSDYPGLKSLAWQLRPETKLSLFEAWSIYARNWRHLDRASLDDNELRFLNALTREFGGPDV